MLRHSKKTLIKCIESVIEIPITNSGTYISIRIKNLLVAQKRIAGVPQIE